MMPDQMVKLKPICGRRGVADGETRPRTHDVVIPGGGRVLVPADHPIKQTARRPATPHRLDAWSSAHRTA